MPPSWKVFLTLNLHMWHVGTLSIENLPTKPNLSTFQFSKALNPIKLLSINKLTNFILIKFSALKTTKLKTPSTIRIKVAFAITFLSILFINLPKTTGDKPSQMGPTTQCSMSEHTCTNGKCISMNKFCDKTNDCGDSSDEPRFCTRKFFFNKQTNKNI